MMINHAAAGYYWPILHFRTNDSAATVLSVWVYRYNSGILWFLLFALGSVH